ncbi:MAG TPA: hypothetical protein VIA62_17980 [Thermoanaerobaculia bacterium]|jgi:hypothetical protein|nr:hypothetical protein [Thermoanaerobaculia bacterium]
MDHPEIFKLIIGYTLVGAFVFTVIVTCLSLVGVVRFASQNQQKRLFQVLIVELVVGALGIFFQLVSLNPAKTTAHIAERTAQEADLSLARKTATELRRSVAPGSAKLALRFRIYTPATGVFRLFLDGREVAIGPGELAAQVVEGEHVLQWVVASSPGSRYSVAIISPATLIFRTEHAIDASGRDAGVHWFSLGPTS